MRRARRTSAVVAAFIVTMTLGRGAAQRGAPPPPPPPPPTAPAPVRDGARAADAGTAFIGGMVLTDDAAATPVRRATVTLRNMDSAVSRTSVSDDSGRFAFTNLPAGRFALLVSKPAYVAASYGARMPRGQGLTIALADAQRITDLVAKIARGAVITGRVVDQNGQAAIGVRIGVTEQVMVNGEATYRTSFGLGSSVDDRGIYRIFGLPAGTYLVGASGGPIVGPAGGAPRITTNTEVQWAMRGNSAAPGAAQPAPPPRGPSLKPATVFYPGTTDSTSASPITLAAGEERAGIDFTVLSVPTASLEGTVIRADGQPVRGVQVLPILMSRSIQIGFPEFPPRANVTPQGRFSVSGLSPGRYMVSARASSGSPAPSAPAPGGRGAPAPPAMDLWALTEIDVAGQDITDLMLTLAPGMTVSGRIAFEAKTTPVPADLSAARVNMMAPPSTIVSLGVPAGQANADGSFNFLGVAPGSYLLTAYLPGGSPLNPTWALKSAIADGRDVLDTPLEVRPGIDTTGIVVTFTDQITQLSGTLTDQTGRPAPNYFVIVFSANSTYWRQQSRWIRMPTRPASDGKFTISGLPPGEYHLAALTEFSQAEWYTPAFLQQLVPMSLKISLSEGEKKVQDLKLAGQ